MQVEFKMNYGSVNLRTLVLRGPDGYTPGSITDMVEGKTIPCAVSRNAERVVVELSTDVELAEGESLFVLL